MREEVFLGSFAESGESMQRRNDTLQSTNSALLGSCSLPLSVIKPQGVIPFRLEAHAELLFLLC